MILWQAIGVPYLLRRVGPRAGLHGVVGGDGVPGKGIHWIESNHKGPDSSHTLLADLTWCWGRMRGTCSCSGWCRRPRTRPATGSRTAWPRQPYSGYWLAHIFTLFRTMYRVTTINVSRKWIEWAEWATSLCTANSPFPGHVYSSHSVDRVFLQNPLVGKFKFQRRLYNKKP